MQRSGKVLVGAARGWVRALLLLYPRAFRRRFAADMLHDFDERLGERAARGVTPVVVLIAQTTVDVAVAALCEWLRPSVPRDVPSRHDHRTARTRGSPMDHLKLDLRFALRSLARRPGFTAIAVITLALAIGANTAIFSVVNAVLLQGFPFADADRLVWISGVAPGSDLEGEIVADEFYVEYREKADRLDDVGLYRLFQSTTRVEERVERLFWIQATPSVFTTLGVRPLLGRLPRPDDENVVVISHWLWADWFGADPAVLDRSYEFADTTRTVIGVMGPEFRFPDQRVAFWTPMDIEPVEAGGFGGLKLIGRMAPETDHAAVAAQIEPLVRRLPERYGGSASYAELTQQYRPVVRSLKEHLVGGFARSLWILSATVGLVLLMACVNVANLFMVHAESRRQDLAVRHALGAGRAGLIRVQMVEALLLAGAGGGIGAFIAWAGVPLLIRAAPDAVASGWSSAPIPGLATVGIDPTALLFTAGISLLAACGFGLAPAIRFSGHGLLGSLRQTGRGIVGRTHLGRDLLVVLQTASALVLLVGSALLARSFVQLSRVDPGYDTEDIFTFQIAVDRSGLDDRASVSQFQYAFVDRVAALPGVESVGFITYLPLYESPVGGLIVTPRIEANRAETPFMRSLGVGGAYFQTMGIELLSGRYFEPIEWQRGSSNVIISRTAAELLFPGEDPLGQRIRHADEEDTWYTVIGVVEDVLFDDFRRESPEPMVYRPLAARSPAYVVRSARADRLAPEIRAVIRDVIPESPMYRAFTMEQLAANTMADLSFTMLMIGIAAALALILGAVGIYGVLSYVVTQRTGEIAVRIALGAQPQGLRRMVVWQGGRLAIVGVGLGLLAALAVTRFLETLLFGVQAIDASTFAGMSSVMLAVALLASYVPARRASSVDPMQSLQTE